MTTTADHRAEGLVPAVTPEPDYGTPAVHGEATANVTIDGTQVRVPPGTSVMRAAREAGIDIPKLCATDRLAAFGSCRLCVVEVDGAKGVPASCTTPCADGMVVRTDTEQVRQVRHGVMELYLSDHPTDCAGCARGSCEMQDLARRTGVAQVRYGLGDAPMSTHLDGGTAHDGSNPYFDYDPQACIVCSRCVRACADIQGTFALTVQGRGFDSQDRPRPHRLPRLGVRLLRRVRAGLPDRGPGGEVGGPARDADAGGRDHLRLLRGGLLVPR